VAVMFLSGIFFCTDFAADVLQVSDFEADDLQVSDFEADDLQVSDFEADDLQVSDFAADVLQVSDFAADVLQVSLFARIWSMRISRKVKPFTMRSLRTVDVNESQVSRSCSLRRLFELFIFSLHSDVLGAMAAPYLF
jgi:hypothetical protein